MLRQTLLALFATSLLAGTALAGGDEPPRGLIRVDQDKSTAPGSDLTVADAAGPKLRKPRILRVDEDPSTAPTSPKGFIRVDEDPSTAPGAGSAEAEEPRITQAPRVRVDEDTQAIPRVPLFDPQSEAETIAEGADTTADEPRVIPVDEDLEPTPPEADETSPPEEEAAPPPKKVKPRVVKKVKPRIKMVMPEGYEEDEVETYHYRPTYHRVYRPAYYSRSYGGGCHGGGYGYGW